MNTKGLSLPLVGALLLGCASTTSEDTVAPAPAAAEDGAESEAELAELKSELAVARGRLEVARMELKAFEAKHEARVRHAAADVEMAEAKLAAFQSVGSPTQVAEARLDLRSARDRAQEAADELAQIEIMYADQDLDDLTAEFVVSRGRRAAERAQQRIEIQEARFQGLQERDLPLELKQLTLALDKAEGGRDDVMREGEIERKQKELGMREKEAAIEKLEHKLVEAMKGAK